MKIKTYTKKILPKNFQGEKIKSIRTSIEIADTFFDILKDILVEDNPYTRIEIRNLVFLNQNLQKLNLELEILLRTKKYMFQLIKKLILNQVD